MTARGRRRPPLRGRTSAVAAARHPRGQHAESRVPGVRAEGRPSPARGEQRQLAREVRQAAVALVDRGLVGGRRAPHRGGDVGAARARSPSSARRTAGWFANPARASRRTAQSPDRSPVNTRPVRLPPCAAGARPTTSTRAAGSPNPGSGRPQYVSSAERGPLLARDQLPPRDEPRHARQATISAVNAASPASREVGLDTAPWSVGALRDGAPTED